MPMIARIAMALSSGVAVFLAFGWPFVFGNDPASEPFHVVAVATLIVWLASVAAGLVARR